MSTESDSLYMVWCIQSLWEVNIFHLDGAVNAVAYVGASVGLTLFVALCGGWYLRLSGTSVGQRRSDDLQADLARV
jgi:hypothetical protein